VGQITNGIGSISKQFADKWLYPSSYQILKVDLAGMIPSKLSKINILTFESNLVLTITGEKNEQ
jgi:hypothetical protein